MLSTILNRLRNLGPKGIEDFPPPRPDRPLAVIGDIHGCCALLYDLLDKLPSDAQLVLVGDYIDRGENSAEVLRYLSRQPNLICLRGNHEDMLLRFLEDPARHGSRWLQHGGLQTLASFHIAGVHLGASAEVLEKCRDALLAEMGPELVDFISQLAPSYQSGNVLVTHAGANPKVAPDQQTAAALTWGHPNFSKIPRRDGIWVVYGHVIHDQPTLSQGRIAIDTGAYATGTLCAVYLTPDAEPRFISATE